MRVLLGRRPFPARSTYSTPLEGHGIEIAGRENRAAGFLGQRAAV